MALIMNFMKNIWFKSGIDFKDFFHAVFLLPEQHQTKMVLLEVLQFYPTATVHGIFGSKHYIYFLAK